MLQLTPKTLKSLRIAIEQRNEKVRRQVPAKKLNENLFRHLVDSTTAILMTGRPSKFEFEGACRHGLRSSLCLQGWNWSDAHAAAAGTVAAALRGMGAERPTWQQGQPEWTQDGFSPIERIVCVNCGNRLPSDSGYSRMYCSDVCATAAHYKQARLHDIRMTRAEWAAAMAAKRAKTLRERERDCDHCGQPFTPDHCYKRRRYCSPECYRGAERKCVRQDKPCAHCRTIFHPKYSSETGESRYCSRKCGAAARIKPPIETPCPVCKTIFRSRRGAVHCSKKCSGTARRTVSPFLCEAAE